MSNELTKEQWQRASDLAGVTASQIINLASGGDIKTAAQMMLDWRKIIEALIDERTTPLDVILVEEVAITWLHLRITQYKAEIAISSGLSFQQGDFWERRVNAAQRRHLRAAETLARVQKIERTGPALQLNIAEQQVNVAS